MFCVVCVCFGDGVRLQWVFILYIIVCVLLCCFLFFSQWVDFGSFLWINQIVSENSVLKMIIQCQLLRLNRVVGISIQDISVIVGIERNWMKKVKVKVLLCRWVGIYLLRQVLMVISLMLRLIFIRKWKKIIFFVLFCVVISSEKRLYQVSVIIKVRWWFSLFVSGVSRLVLINSFIKVVEVKVVWLVMLKMFVCLVWKMFFVSRFVLIYLVWKRLQSLKKLLSESRVINDYNLNEVGSVLMCLVKLVCGCSGEVQGVLLRIWVVDMVLCFLGRMVCLLMLIDC